MHAFRLFTRSARPSVCSSFFTSATYYSTSSRPAAGAQKMIGAEEIIRTHGLTIFKGLAVAGVGGAVISRFLMNNTADAETPEGKMQQQQQQQQQAKKIFGRPGPVFTSLALQSSEDVTSDVKRLRFALPAETDVSGLPLTCKFFPICLHKKKHHG